jgi:predicted TIM-barrel fold metal-dependent hydrolase
LMESTDITDDDKAAMLYRNAERFYKPESAGAKTVASAKA